MNQTENPKKRESSSQEKQENENWGDQLSNNNFGPDQDYNDNDQNKNDDAVEIMNTIDQNDLGPNHLLLWWQISAMIKTSNSVSPLKYLLSRFA